MLMYMIAVKAHTVVDGVVVPTQTNCKMDIRNNKSKLTLLGGLIRPRPRPDIMLSWHVRLLKSRYFRAQETPSTLQLGSQYRYVQLLKEHVRLIEIRGRRKIEFA